MDSKIISDNIIIVLVLLGTIFIVSWSILQYQIYNFKKRLDELFGKKSSEDIEKILTGYVKGVKHYFEEVDELKKFSEKLYEHAEKSIQKVAMIRFNPFNDVGGNQSFSIAMLDLNDNGILITSLFGREGTRVYSKKITSGIPESFLSEEEQDVLKKAIKNKRSLNVSREK